MCLPMLASASNSESPLAMIHMTLGCALSRSSVPDAACRLAVKYKDYRAAAGTVESLMDD